MNDENLFRTFDVDSSGEIAEDKLQQLASKMIPESIGDKAFLDGLMKDIDLDKNQVIDFSEFKCWRRRFDIALAEKACPTSFWEMNAESLFRTIDVDNSGKIDMNELQQLASELFPESIVDEANLDEVYLDGLMKDMDTDKNQLVDFEEFKRWLSLQVSVLVLARLTCPCHCLSAARSFANVLCPSHTPLGASKHLQGCPSSRCNQQQCDGGSKAINGRSITKEGRTHL